MTSLLEAEGLRRRYGSRGLLARRGSGVVAVDGVSLQVGRSEACGVVGESGAGKSTLVRLLLALERPDAGVVRFDGVPISRLRPGAVRPLRRRFQAVFQDPEASLDPCLSIGASIAEPLRAHRLGTSAWRRQRVRELLQLVGLAATSEQRRPAAFSGGERQRIALARALATEPELLLLDEPLSCLDVSVQRYLLDLLRRLRHRLGLSLLLISHDLQVVRELCDRVSIMLQGVVVEEGPVATVLSRPAHPYTRQLLATIPALDPDWSPPETDGSREPAATWQHGCCRYRARCPQVASRCQQEPPLLPVSHGHRAACWFGLQDEPARDSRL